MRTLPALLVLGSMLALAACADSPGDASDAATGDVGCTRDADCDDGLFCDGVERCAAGLCMVGGPACATGETCDEAMDRCSSPCDVTPDADGDGARSAACGGTDCDDADPTAYPGATEVCDVSDHDEDCDPRTFGVRDGDGDGIADALCCNVAMDGTRHCGTDCDDTSRNVSPNVPEVCNDVDDDCDAAIDEGVRRTFYADVDADGFGDPATATQACLPPLGTVENGTDCDDANAFSHTPSDPEVCDMHDDDCDGAIDEDAATVLWYVDADGDLFGDVHDSAPIASCTPVAGHVTNDTDCDDAVGAVHPGAIERCNAIDDDCSSGGGADPSEDADGDGYAPTTATCLGGLPTTDCADTDASVHPGAAYGTTPVCPTTGSEGPTEWCSTQGCCVAAGGGCHIFGTTCLATGWDLDCDGTDEPQPSLTPADCEMIGAATCTGSGLLYAGAPPACGTDVMSAACFWNTATVACDLLMSDGDTTPLPCR